ncbi:MAG: sigma factor G inhibitor Gin [Bacillota bacterium]|nr:sigma factor G inhibitor Gin [Bacillota bacterium]
MIRTIDTQTQIPAEVNKDIEGHDSSSEGRVLPVCYRCAQVPQNGLYDGFRVEGMFFCSDCQQELFTAEQGSPEYQEFMVLIKEIIF